MTIAEKLQKIAKNQKDIYEAGYMQGEFEGSQDGYARGLADGEGAGIEIGKQVAYDAFWDSYQNNGERTGYNFLFSGTGWSDDLYNPKYPINMFGQSNNVYEYNSKITSTKVPISVSHTASSSLFYYCSSLVTIPSIKVTVGVNFTTWFSGCKALKTILFTEDSVIGNNISFSACVALSRQSIETIVNALSSDVSEKALTLSRAAVNTAFETSEGAANGIESETWLNLIATKNNWQFNLV